MKGLPDVPNMVPRSYERHGIYNHFHRIVRPVETRFLAERIVKPTCRSSWFSPFYSLFLIVPEGKILIDPANFCAKS